MTRGHRLSSKRGPAERQLRMGGLARGSALTALVILLGATPALAEVCDKAVGESWQAADGPVWLLNPVGFPTGLMFLLVGFAIIHATKSAMVGLLLGGLVLSLATVLVLLDVLGQHEIYLAQVSEGCRSVLTDVLDAAALAATGAGYVWYGRRANARRHVLQSAQV